MARNSFGLGFLFTAKDSASPVMRGVDKSFRQMDKSTNRSQQRMQAAQGAMAVGMGAMAVGAVGLGTALKAALAAGDFEQGVAKVGAISGATADELQALSEKALQAGIDTQFTPKEAIDGLGELTVRGLTAGEAMNALDGALNLAAGGQISIAQASSTTASALKVFGLEADQAGIAADKLLKISNVTALQANDLELALGTVGRGAGIAKQSIDEMLPSIGLVKNTGVDASTAASSVSSALIKMATDSAKFKKIGVHVTDAQGKFRPFMDIILETTEALDKIPDAAKRVKAAQDLFGKFGLTSFNAIGTQLSKGIRNAEGDIVKGAEALKFLRDSMKGAEGTAKSFADALLDTLPGQITLLKGSIATLGIELGRPLAEAMKPAVEFVKEGVNKIINLVKGMSPSMRKALGVVLILVSGLFALGGAILLMAGMAFLAAPGLLALGGALAGAAGSIALVAGVVATLAVLFGVLRKAFDDNIGGFADKVGPLIDKVKLFFSGLFQFIEDGFFSGETARKLQDPDNIGVLKFLSVLIRMGFRVRKFFSGISEGFGEFMAAAGPVFDGLGDALNRVAEAFGLVAGDADDALGPSKQFAEAGKFIGKVFGRLVTIIVNVVAALAAVFAGMIKGFRSAMAFVKPFVDVAVEAFGEIGTAIVDIVESLGSMDAGIGSSGDVWETFGAVLGFISAMFLSPITFAFTVLAKEVAVVFRVLSVVAGAMRSFFEGFFSLGEAFVLFLHGDFAGAWAKVGEGVKHIWEGVKSVFLGLFDIIKDQVNSLLNLLAEVGAALPEEVRPEFLNRFIAARNQEGAAGAAALGAGIDADQEQNLQLQQSFSGPTIPYANNIAGAADAQSRQNQEVNAAAREEVKQGFIEAMQELRSGNSTKAAQRINLIMDGEAIGQARVLQDQKEAALGFGGDFFGED